MSSKYGFSSPTSLGIPQGQPHDPSPSGLQRDDVFAARQDDPTDGDHVHFGNGVANNRKGVLSNLAIRSKVLGGVDRGPPPIVFWGYHPLANDLPRGS
jgi:hypothetical protein